MSAYIVDLEKIDQVLTYINASHHRTSCGHAFARMGYQLDNTDSLSELGSALHLMNCDAVDQRYSKGTAAKDTGGTGVYEFSFRTCSAVDAYKAAKCLRYQCSEGDVFKRPLFRALDSVIAGIADAIIQDLPEYTLARRG